MTLDPATSALLGVIAVMATNQVVIRISALRAHPGIFWTLQAINVVTACLIIWFGIPGLEQYPIVSWFIALLFILRTVQNTNSRAVWLRERVKEERAEGSARAAEIRAKLID